jgi:hypothetical protein
MNGWIEIIRLLMERETNAEVMQDILDKQLYAHSWIAFSQRIGSHTFVCSEVLDTKRI